MPSLYMNGRNYTGSGGEGGGDVYGAFVDTNRVIQASTNIPANTDVSYMATEDCAVVWALIASNNGTYSVSVDGEAIASGWTQTGARSNQDSTFLRRGQTITMRQSYGDANGNYTVYGLTFGTQNIFTPQIYSTEERCVGVWIDNKPLYAKSYHLNSLSSSVTVLDANASVETLVNAYGGASDGDRQYQIPYAYGNDEIRVMADDAGTWTTAHGLVIQASTALFDADIYVTAYYTKTTDIAGSGSFNTLGVPMMHYSTSEQVVGTWINGETIYCKCYSTTIDNAENKLIDSTLNNTNIHLLPMSSVSMDAHGIYNTSFVFNIYTDCILRVICNYQGILINCENYNYSNFGTSEVYVVAYYTKSSS